MNTARKGNFSIRYLLLVILMSANLSACFGYEVELAEQSENGLLRLTQVIEIPEITASGRQLYFHPDGRQLAVGGGEPGDTAFTVMDTESGEIIGQYEKPGNSDLAGYSPDGQRFLIKDVRVYENLPNGKRRLDHQEFYVLDSTREYELMTRGRQLGGSDYGGFALTGDSIVVTHRRGGDRGGPQVMKYSPKTGELIQQFVGEYGFDGNSFSNNSLAFSPDGRYVAIAERSLGKPFVYTDYRHAVVIFDLASLEVVKTVDTGFDMDTNTANVLFDESGKYLVLAPSSVGLTEVSDPATGETRRTLPHHDKIKIVEWRTSKLERELGESQGGIHRIYRLRDDRFMTYGRKRELLIWDMNESQWIDRLEVPKSVLVTGQVANQQGDKIAVLRYDRQRRKDLVWVYEVRPRLSLN